MKAEQQSYTHQFCIDIVHREFVFCKRYIVPPRSSASVTSHSTKTPMKECIRTSIHGAMEQINRPCCPLLVLHCAMLLPNVRRVCKWQHVSYNPLCPPPPPPPSHSLSAARYVESSPLWPTKVSNPVEPIVPDRDALLPSFRRAGISPDVPDVVEAVKAAAVVIITPVSPPSPSLSRTSFDCGGNDRGSDRGVVIVPLAPFPAHPSSSWQFASLLPASSSLCSFASSLTSSPPSSSSGTAVAAAVAAAAAVSAGHTNGLASLSPLSTRYRNAQRSAGFVALSPGMMTSGRTGGQADGCPQATVVVDDFIWRPQTMGKRHRWGGVIADAEG